MYDQSKPPSYQSISQGYGAASAPTPPRYQPTAPERQPLAYGYQPQQQRVTTGVTVVTQPCVALVNCNITTKPNNYQSLAIFSCIFCWMFGLIALMYSREVDTAWNNRDYVGAWLNSRKARIWSRVSISMGLAVVASVGIALGAYYGTYDDYY